MGQKVDPWKEGTQRLAACLCGVVLAAIVLGILAIAGVRF